MISKQYYQELLSDDPHKRDYTLRIEDFFNYVIDTQINGNYQQLREFINRMSGSQFFLLLQYLKGKDQDTQQYIKLRVW